MADIALAYIAAFGFSFSFWLFVKLKRSDTLVMLHFKLDPHAFSSGLTTTMHCGVVPRYNYICESRLPRRIYVGDSANITFQFVLFEGVFGSDSQGFRNKSRWELHIPSPEKEGPALLPPPYYLELELLAAGFLIDGEKKQRQKLGSTHLAYSWNCFFPNSGNHTFAMRAKACEPLRQVDLGTKEFELKVAQVFGLTKRQVWAIGTIGTIISGALAVFEIMRRLGWL